MRNHQDTTDNKRICKDGRDTPGERWGRKRGPGEVHESLKDGQKRDPFFFLTFYFIFKYILLIMLLQLSHFPPLFSSALHTLSHPHYPPQLSSCPWVVHVNSLASTIPILFLTSSVYFVPTIYASHSLYLFPHSLPSPSSLMIPHGISISVILFLF